MIFHFRAIFNLFSFWIDRKIVLNSMYDIYLIRETCLFLISFLAKMRIKGTDNKLNAMKWYAMPAIATLFTSNPMPTNRQNYRILIIKCDFQLRNVLVELLYEKLKIKCSRFEPIRCFSLIDLEYMNISRMDGKSKSHGCPCNITFQHWKPSAFIRHCVRVRKFLLSP